MERFNSNENKAFLWDILNKKGVFNGLRPESIHPTFEKLFSETLARHSNARNVNMMALNKEFLSSFVKTTRQQSNFQERNTLDNTDTLEKIYDTNQIRKDVVDDFNREYANKQNEFQETIRLKRPEEVDFTDKNEEEPIDSNRIDELLKQQLEKRNLDIPKINDSSQEFQKASNWITNSDDNEEKIKANKSVSFKDNIQIELQSNTSSNNTSVQSQGQTHIGKPSLKNGLLNNDSIHKKLDEILENQKYIINNIHELLDRR